MKKKHYEFKEDYNKMYQIKFENRFKSKLRRYFNRYRLRRLFLIYIPIVIITMTIYIILIDKILNDLGVL